MKIIRQMLVFVISAGLVLAPVQAAMAMPMTPAAAGDSSPASAAPPMDQDCACCNAASRCPMVVCATHCVQLAPAADANFLVVVLGHAVMRPFVPPVHDGHTWQPPTPPPRV